MNVILTLFLACFFDRFETLDLVRLIQSRVVVEQVGNEGKIELVHTIDDILWGYERTAVQFCRLLQHYLGTV